MITHPKNTRIVWALLASLSIGPALYAGAPDPDNAALLYYQAFISLPRDNDRAGYSASGLPEDAEPNAAIRAYLEKCRPAIDLGVAASEIPACRWGLRYSQGAQVSMPHLAQMRAMARLMKAHAAVLAADGRCRQALERGLVIRRMARHVGDETLISFLVGTAINAMADKAIQNALGAAPLDEQTVVWLKQELTAPSTGLQIRDALKGEESLFTAEMRPGNERLIEVAKTCDGITPSQIEQLRRADDAFFKGSREYYTSYIQSVLAVLDGPELYGQKRPHLEDLEKKPGLDAKQDPRAILTAMQAISSAKFLKLDLRARANDGILLAALEIYWVKCKTGSLPDQLPPVAARDPFNGQGFKYEQTSEGFVLSRWTDEPSKDPTYRHMFKVK